MSDAFEDELREYLLDRLPVYMVPATILIHKELPLTVQGKVDRAALTQFIQVESDDAVLPTDALTSDLIGIWSEVLARTNIGSTDTFLSLGGDSLAATQVNVQVFERFGILLPPQWFLKRASVSEIATEIRELLKVRASETETV